jgi:hypothetical protein
LEDLMGAEHDEHDEHKGDLYTGGEDEKGNTGAPDMGEEDPPEPPGPGMPATLIPQTSSFFDQPDGEGKDEDEEQAKTDP